MVSVALGDHVKTPWYNLLLQDRQCRPAVCNGGQRLAGVFATEQAGYIKPDVSEMMLTTAADKYRRGFG